MQQVEAEKRQKLDEAPTAPAEEPVPDLAEQGRGKAISERPSNPMNAMNTMSQPMNLPADNVANQAVTKDYPSESKVMPEPVEEASAEEPAALVRRYYDSINQRDFEQAYNCLSANFKTRRPVEQFQKIFAGTQSATLQNLEEGTRDDSTALVAASFSEVDAESRTRLWQGTLALVKEGSAWRIDAIHMKQKGPAIRAHAK